MHVSAYLPAALTDLLLTFRHLPVDWVLAGQMAAWTALLCLAFLCVAHPAPAAPSSPVPLAPHPPAVQCLHHAHRPRRGWRIWRG